MSRADGFDRMDVSTSIADDPKFRALARLHPELAATALAVYLAGLLATSWREGERLTIEEAWPTIVPWSEATVAAMIEVKLLDSDKRVLVKAWEGWYGAASDRRRAGRDRQHRYDVKRGRSGKEPASPPAPPSTSVRTDRQSGRQAGRTSVGPTLVQRRSDVGQPGATTKVPSEGECRICGAAMTDQESCRVGPGWIEHAEHPEDFARASLSA